MAVNINVPSQVKTYANLAAFPATGALKTIYIAEDTNKTYRWTGSVYVEVSASAASGITIGSTAIASGVVGRVLFEGAGNVVQESSSLFWDNPNGILKIGAEGLTGSVANSKLVITGDGSNTPVIIKNTGTTGNTASEIQLRVFDGVTFVGSTSGSIISLNNTWSYGNFLPLETMYTSHRAVSLRSANANPIRFLIRSGDSAVTDASEMMRIVSTGNVLINTTTDAGFRLDVNGTARVQGTINIGTNVNVGIGSTLNGTTFVNNGPAILYASAGIFSSQVYAHNFFTGNFTAASGTQGFVNFTGATFNPTSGTAVFNTINATPTINQTGGANGITRGLYINPTLTSAADFRAIETTAGRVIFGGLPTSSAGLPTGAIWNDAGTLKIV